MKTKNMTTLQLRKTIAVMFISVFAVSVSSAAPTDSPQPTASSAQSSKAQKIAGGLGIIPKSTQKAEGEASAGAGENPKSQTTRPMKSHGGVPQSQTTRPMKATATSTLKTQNAEGQAQAHSKRGIAAINRNKAERDALFAAVKSKNTGEIGRILRAHGFDTGHEPVMQVNGYCFRIWQNGWVWACCDPSSHNFDIQD